MNRLKLLLLPCLLLTMATVLLFRTGVTQAASASGCGGWSVVKSPNVGSPSILNAVATVSANDVWAVGYSTGYKPLIEHWNGSAWQVVPATGLHTISVLHGLAVISANDIWAVGSGGGNVNGKGIAIHWDGTQWSIVPTPNPAAGSDLFGVTAVSSNDVWATGLVDQTDSGGFYDTLVEHWNGKSWKIVPSPSSVDEADNLQSVSAVSANNIWAVGTINAGVSGSVPEIEHWNGQQWSMVTPPKSGKSSSLNSVTAISATNIWVVGTTDNKTLVEHYDGTTWSVVPSPNVGTGINSLSSVTAISASNLWAVGYYVNSSGISQTLIEQWNGTKWSVVSSPNVGSSNNTLNAAAAVVGSTQVWAVGYYSASSAYKTLTEHYC